MDSTSHTLRALQRLSTVLVVVMVTQASLGLVLPTAYRDVEWIRATWFGNDCVTLIVAVPLLVVALVFIGRGSVRGLLLGLGIIAYAAYNYAFYLFGAALNAFLPIYVVALLLSVVLLILALSQINVNQIAGSVRQTVPVRLIGGSLVFIGTGLASVWIVIWGAYVFAGRPTPVEPEAFKLVAALDLSAMVPALMAGGILLWRRMHWGYTIAAVASIQGTLYLFVLSTNSVVLIYRGLAKAPGELPLWATLTVFMAAVALLLLVNVGQRRSRL